MSYYCKRCGYSSKYKCNMKTHYLRKKPCKAFKCDISYNTLRSLFFKTNYKMILNEPKMNPNEPKMNPNEPKMNLNEPFMNFKGKRFVCEYCNKTYSTNSHMRRHQKKCFKKNELLITNESNKLLNLFKKQVEIVQEEKNILKKEILEIKKQHTKNIETLLKKVGNKTHIENQQINIHINNYGNENLDYISDQYLSNLIKIPYKSIQKLIKVIHFHPKHPENHNIKITNKKLPYASVWKDNKWHVVDKKEVIKGIVDKSYNIIDSNNTEHQLIGNKKINFQRFIKEYDNSNKNLHKTLQKETEMILINNTN